MNKNTSSIQLRAGEVATARATAPRSPRPAAIKVLLPVWGVGFVRQFLEFTLPTLLAPGNVPALAKALPCQFVVLTDAFDEDVIRAHRAWRRLEATCPAEIQRIDDLIVDGNHSTTLTLAYTRAIRLTGERMLDTCFILLVSDYIVADGSLGRVLARMQEGASCVLVGNFQIAAEEAVPLLRGRLTSAAPDLVLPPRDLLRSTLSHLHPATVASIANDRRQHKSHTNRLFWRVDDGTLLGRFYLLHPVAVRPEVTDFVIGSSFDYSFVPEMCPSGNVAAITDSDDYLVVEMQPRAHEAEQVRPGPIQPRQLAKSLSEWTTARHRDNVRHTFVYHTAEIPTNVAVVAKQANAFIAEVAGNLPPAAQPHRNHPYWIGAVAAHRAQLEQTLTAQDWRFLLGAANAERALLIEALFRCRMAFFGAPPQVRPWHPLWPDYRPLLQALGRLIAPDGELLVVTREPKIHASWLAKNRYRATTVAIDQLLHLPRHRYLPLVGKFDGCVIFQRQGDFPENDALLACIGPLLKPGGHTLIGALNESPADAADFAASLARGVGRFDSPLRLQQIRCLPCSRARWRVRKLMTRLSRGVSNRPPYQWPFVALAAAGTAVLSCLFNLRASPTAVTRGTACSSIFAVLSCPASGPDRPLPEFEPEQQTMHAPLATVSAPAVKADAQRNPVD